jgi:hypothetical protein
MSESETGLATLPADAAKLSAPSLRGLVNKQFPDLFNGGLIYATKDELLGVLSGGTRASSLQGILSRRKKKRQEETGKVVGRTKKAKTHTEKARKWPASTKKRATTPPPAKSDIDAGNGLAPALTLAGRLSMLSEVFRADGMTLRRAVNILIAAREQ